MSNRKILRVWPVIANMAVTLTLATTGHAEDLSKTPDQTVLREHVNTLASPAYQGRRGPGARLAARYILKSWKESGLRPLFGTKFTQDIVDPVSGGRIGINLGGYIEGTDPALAREWIVLGVHYDHLGIRNGVLFPGADDNASSVAMMLEAARCLSKLDPQVAPRRSVVFLAFDLEEDGLVGSQYFVDNSPWPLESLKLMVTGDMLSRSLGGVCESDLYVMGTEYAPELRPSLKRAAVDLPLKLKMIGNDMLAIDRSDYGPFRRRQIPFLFFSTGENPAYHTPDDRPETIDPAKLASASRLIFTLVKEFGSQDRLPSWSSDPVHEISEALAILDTLQVLQAHGADLKLNVLQKAMIRGVIKELEPAIARGKLTFEERQKLVTQAQVILFSIL